jgi:hypothetical protein
MDSNVLQQPVTAPDINQLPTALPGHVAAAHSTAKTTANQDPNAGVNLWHDAFDRLEQHETDLVEAYRKILTESLLKEKLEELKAKENEVNSEDNGGKTTAEREALKAKILEELRDRTQREIHMKFLVEQGKKKFAKSSKIVKAVDSFAKAILWPKPIVDTVLSSTPQAAPAALPWAGACFVLEASRGAFPQCPLDNNY